MILRKPVAKIKPSSSRVALLQKPERKDELVPTPGKGIAHDNYCMCNSCVIVYMVPKVLYSLTELGARIRWWRMVRRLCSSESEPRTQIDLVAFTSDSAEEKTLHVPTVLLCGHHTFHVLNVDKRNSWCCHFDAMCTDTRM